MPSVSYRVRARSCLHKTRSEPLIAAQIVHAHPTPFQFQVCEAQDGQTRANELQ